MFPFICLFLLCIFFSIFFIGHSISCFCLVEKRFRRISIEQKLQKRKKHTSISMKKSLLNFTFNVYDSFVSVGFVVSLANGKKSQFFFSIGWSVLRMLLTLVGICIDEAATIITTIVAVVVVVIIAIISIIFSIYAFSHSK